MTSKKRLRASGEEQTISFRKIFKFKWLQWKKDHRIPLLTIIEIILSVGVAAAIALYLDPEVNVVPFPWNVLAFTILAGMAMMVHRRTRPYRIARKVQKSMIVEK